MIFDLFAVEKMVEKQSVTKNHFADRYAAAKWAEVSPTVHVE
jgi:hypothetical protein